MEQRTKTKLVVIIGGILVAISGILSNKGCHYLVDTHTLKAKVLNQVQISERKVDIWTTKRNYGRSSVPKCAWDTERDVVLECFTRNEDGQCIMYVPKTYYDYSIRDWKKFTILHDTFYNKPFQYLTIPQFDIAKYRYKYQWNRFYLDINVLTDSTNSVQRLEVSKEVFDRHTRGRDIEVSCYKRNNKAKNIVE